ncbi:MAG: hypothetical protein J1G38_00595 [Clostridiales bacterium]|nr:hypothetical protein [Clostridiales bacterium]
MKVKKALIFVLCAVLALPLVACEKDGASGTVKPGDSNKEYTVTFDIGDDARAAGVSYNYPAQKVKSGKTLSDKDYFYPRPTWDDDHPFEGWYEGNNALYNTTKITRDWNVVAKWGDAAADREAAEKYESNISSWDEAGHLYIHYKRAGHAEANQGKKYNGDGPEYDDPQKAIKDDLYGDWGLWLWPTNGALEENGTTYSYEGILFYPSKIDESGAVYDILLDHTYTKGGWNENTLTDKGLNVNYVVQSDKSLRSMKMQLFRISSRIEDGFWKNDGGNVDLNNSAMKREKGSYHWFVTQGSVGSGSAKFSGKEVEDKYADDVNHDLHPTDKSLDNPLNINSNVSNKSKYNINDVPVQDYETTGVGYQVFIASFRDGQADDAYTPKGKGMGDLRGVIDALEEGYFDKLNVDVLWLTPFQSSTNYHGYDIKDYYSVDPRFGTINDYRELVYKAHARGIKVVMDFVLNHTAENNPWYVKSVNLTKEQNVTFAGNTYDEVDYRNFYNWITKAQYDTIPGEPNEFKKDGSRNPNYNPVKAQWYEDSHGYYFYSSFGSSMPELNYDYQPVRDAILDVCNYWMAFGLDGFRLDAVKHIYMKNEVQFTQGGPSGDIRDNNNAAYAYDMTRNMNFWREFNYKLKSHYPNAFLVGENLDGNPENVGPFFEGMDSQFNFHNYYEAGHAFAAAGGGGLTYGTMNQAGDYTAWSTKALSSYKKELDGEQYSNETGFHDVKGYKTFNANYIDGRYTSNHDLPRARDLMNMQTHGNDELWRSFFGNAEMDRSANPTAPNLDLVNMTDKTLRLYYAFNMTTPGISWIYYGDELGMTGNMNTRLTGQAEGAHEDRIYRQPMKWFDDVSANATFDIGFNNYKCELVGLNATQYVKGVDEQDKDEGSMLNWMRTLTKVRNDHPELINGSIDWNSAVMNNGLISFVISGKTGSTRVYINTGSATNIQSGKTVYASYNLNGTTLGQYGVAIIAG